MLKKLFFVALIVLIALPGCSIIKDFLPDPNVLVKDDFSSDSYGWYVGKDAESDFRLENGSYIIENNLDNQMFWSNAGISAADVIIDVDITFVESPQEADAGVICRYQDLDNFYYFTIGNDGYYSVTKVYQDEEYLVGMDEMLYSDFINTDGMTNHVQASCIGNTFTLKVNGQTLVTGTDTDLPGAGDIALLNYTYDEPNLTIAFDNLVVTKP